MCHLYDVGDNNELIKHSSFKHDSVQDAILAANADVSNLNIMWETTGINTYGYINIQGNIECHYQIVE